MRFAKKKYSKDVLIIEGGKELWLQLFQVRKGEFKFLNDVFFLLKKSHLGNFLLNFQPGVLLKQK